MVDMKELQTVGFLEPLYLSNPEPDAPERSGKSAVLVDPVYQQYLQQFQKDGIRFLYKQFCKKLPGVILNDGASHGKTVQIVLFLSAINVLLRQQPSLIVCNNRNIDYWKYHICKWIEKGKDLIGEPDNVFAKKLYFVASMDNLKSISRREWAVLVVDDLELSIFTKKSHLLRAKYKIWMSNQDLTSDLVSLNQIYHWLAPRERLNLVSKFSKAGLDKNCAYRQTLDLHTFCDSLLLRRVNERCLPLIDPALHNKLFEQWIEETYGSNVNVNETTVSMTEATNPTEPPNNSQKTTFPNKINKSIARFSKQKNNVKSQKSPKSKKNKLSLSKSSEDGVSFEFLEDSSMVKKIKIESDDNINTSCEVEEECDIYNVVIKNEIYDENETVSLKTNNSEYYEIHKNESSYNSAIDSTETSYASISSNNNSYQHDNSHSIIESVIFSSETPKIHTGNEQKSNDLRKLCISTISEVEVSFEFLEDSCMLKKFKIENDNNINTSCEVEEKCDVSVVKNEIYNENETVLLKMNNSKYYDVHKSESIENDMIDTTETSFASTSGKNYSYKEDNSDSIIENVLFPSETEEIKLDIIKAENLNDCSSESKIESKSTQTIMKSLRNVKEAMRNIEEMSNKQFKGTFLDSLF